MNQFKNGFTSAMTTKGMEIMPHAISSTSERYHDRYATEKRGIMKHLAGAYIAARLRRRIADISWRIEGIRIT
jgi:hypothetical protein